MLWLRDMVQCRHDFIAKAIRCLSVGLVTPLKELTNMRTVYIFSCATSIHSAVYKAAYVINVGLSTYSPEGIFSLPGQTVHSVL